MTNTTTPTRLICPLTAGSVFQMKQDIFAAARAGADMVECRLDFLSPVPSEKDLQTLFADSPLPILATCRPVREGGKFVGDETRRLEILRQAARLGAAFVDVEMDASPADWPSGPVILSHHDFARCPADLDAIVANLEASPALVNKVAFAGEAPEDAFRAFDVIRASRKKTLALAMGEHAVMSRILAGKFGAFGTFAALRKGEASAPGQPTLEEMTGLFRCGGIGPNTRVYGVIGCPVGHSMSPAVHNAAFAAMNMDAVYVPVRIEPGADNFNRFMDALLARPWMDWRGFSVTIPHKEHALAYVGEAQCEQLARTIGAVNTILIEPSGKLHGYNTDYAAAIDSLCAVMGIRREGLAGRNVAVLGAGGAARAIVAALAHYRAHTTIYNRTVSRGEQLAHEFSCKAASMDAAASGDAEILINCTPIGMHPRVNETPLEVIPASVRVVFDTIYNPLETRLLMQAAKGSRAVIGGVEMFIKQAMEQFHIWTGKVAPRDVMHRVIVDGIRQRQK